MISSLTRRDALGVLLAAGTLASGREASARRADKPPSTPKLGIALGSGGARGLAHLSVLEAFEELGLRPSRVTGTSSGALAGALYCGGRHPSELRELIRSRFAGGNDASPQRPWHRYMPRELLSISALVETSLGEGGLLRAERFLDVALSFVEARTFEELSIPLTVVATDFWSREPVLIDSGPLKPALLASMAMPGVFAPARVGGRILVDGGLVNPVPFDLLKEHVDLVVAVSVFGRRVAPAPGAAPSAMESVFQSFQIMEEAITREQRRRDPPDLYIDPRITDVATLEFHRAEEIYKQADAMKPEIKERLVALTKPRRANQRPAKRRR